MNGTSRGIAKVLIVDDNPGVLKLLGAQFRDGGMAVTLASSAAEARAALEAATWDFDLVLSDISMPGETGFDLLKWIKRDESAKRHLPVLLVTAQLPEPENRVKGLAMGAVDYVVRSLDMAELTIRVEHAIEHARRVRALETSLEDSENLAKVGRLLAASHHEIKNLAALVNLAIDQTVKFFAPVACGRGTEALTALSRTAELLTDVSKSVSSPLLPNSAVAKSVDLVALTAEVVDLLRPRVAPCRIVIESSGPVWAAAHAMRVKQVLINLILNAYEAICEYEAEASGLICVAVEDEETGQRVVVRDNGIGFEPAGERSEFQAFATTKKLRGGQGLGLWLCAALVANMGGRLVLCSAGVGLGAQAVLTLPSAAAPPPADEYDVQRYLDELDD